MNGSASSTSSRRASSLKTDRPLTIQWGAILPMKDELALRLTYRIPNEHPGALVIDTNLFPYDPIHQTFINIYEDDDRCLASR